MDALEAIGDPGLRVALLHIRAQPGPVTAVELAAALGVHRNVADLQADILAFIDRHNADPKPFRWTKSADDILASIERFCLYNTPAPR